MQMYWHGKIDKIGAIWRESVYRSQVGGSLSEPGQLGFQILDRSKGACGRIAIKQAPSSSRSIPLSWPLIAGHRLYEFGPALSAGSDVFSSGLGVHHRFICLCRYWWLCTRNA